MSHTQPGAEANRIDAIGEPEVVNEPRRGTRARSQRTQTGADSSFGPSPLEVRRRKILRTANANRVPVQTILFTVAVLVVVYLAAKVLYRIRDVVLLIVLAAIIALILNPLVLGLQRWRVRRRGAAVAIVTFWAVLVFVGLSVAFGYPLVNGLTHLAHSLPNYVRQAEKGRGWIGHLVRKYHVESWVRKNSPKLVTFAENLGRPALTLGKGAASVILTLAALFVLVILLLLEAPKMRIAILNMMSQERAGRYRSLGADITRSVSGYMLGNMTTSIIAGVVVLVTLAALDVPFAPLWALWVALVDFLPTIGGALAGIPTVLFAFTHSVTAGVVTLVVFLVYTQVENHVLNPIVMSRTVRVNPLLIFIAVLVGAAIGSWVGGLFGGFAAALIAIPLAGAIQVVVREVWRHSGETEESQSAVQPATESPDPTP